MLIWCESVTQAYFGCLPVFSAPPSGNLKGWKMKPTQKYQKLPVPLYITSVFWTAKANLIKVALNWGRFKWCSADVGDFSHSSSLSRQTARLFVLAQNSLKGKKISDSILWLPSATLKTGGFLFVFFSSEHLCQKTCCVNMSDCFLWASCFKTFFGCLWMSFQSVRRRCYSNKYMYVFYQLPWIKTIRKQQFERLQWTESVLWSWHSFSLPLASFLPNDSVLVAMHDTELSCALIG